MIIKFINCILNLFGAKNLSPNLANECKKILPEMVRYAITALFNTFVYASTAIILHRVIGLNPLPSNFMALILTFAVGFVGHNFYTYQQIRIAFDAFRRFITLQILLLGMSQSIVYVVTHLLGYIYEIAILASLIVLPPISWTTGRVWVFSGERRETKAPSKRKSKT